MTSSTPASTGSHRDGGTATFWLLTSVAGLSVVFAVLGLAEVGVPYASSGMQVARLAAIVATLVWLYRTFSALKGRAKYSAGFAVGSWFIPIANFFLPALVFRDAWKTTQGSGGGIAILWMFAWWFATAVGVLQGLGLSASSSSLTTGTTVWIAALDLDVGHFDSLTISTYIWGFTLVRTVADLGAYGLLAVIVARVSKSLR